MSEIITTVQNALSTNQHTVLFSYIDSPSSIQSEVRKFLTQSNLGGTSSSLTTTTFELFDNWTFASAINRLQFIPKDTWKRIALFVSMIVVAYYLNGECESYFSLPFLVGAPLMLYALRKTYLYVKAGVFPKVLQVSLSKKEITPVVHDILVNGTDGKGNVLDMFSLEPIPKTELNSAKYLHLPNYIIETTSCLRGLLEKPELKHPVETHRDIKTDELKMFLPQIQSIFNLSEEEFLSCWKDFKASDTEEDSLINHFLEDGNLSSAAMTHLRTNHENIVRDVGLAVQQEVERIVGNLLEQALTQIRSTIYDYYQKCFNALDLETFRKSLVLLLSVISSLGPIKTIVHQGSNSFAIELNSSVRAQQLFKLQMQLELQSFFDISSSQPCYDLVRIQLAEAKQAQEADIKILKEFLLSKELILFFKATELFQSRIKDLEAKKRYEKFKALTDVDVKTKVTI